MSNDTGKRVDEVSEHYDPAKTVDLIGKVLFWLIAAVSLCMPYTASLTAVLKSGLQTTFIVLTLIHFVFSQFNRFYLIPKAERIRRQQMLSNAFDTPITHEKTELYYNNDYTPSVMRLGANTMENSLFSKEIAVKMLIKSRIVIFVYAILWVVAFSFRYNNLETLGTITQILFSGEIAVQWLALEMLRYRHERTYELLHSHFLHKIGDESTKAVATILDAFVAYESAKSSASILLSSKVFDDLNPSLTKKWEQIRLDLKMTPS